LVPGQHRGIRGKGLPPRATGGEVFDQTRPALLTTERKVRPSVLRDILAYPDQEGELAEGEGGDVKVRKIGQGEAFSCLIPADHPRPDAGLCKKVKDHFPFQGKHFCDPLKLGWARDLLVDQSGGLVAPELGKAMELDIMEFEIGGGRSEQMP
jgi:hypothetical protein